MVLDKSAWVKGSKKKRFDEQFLVTSKNKAKQKTTENSSNIKHSNVLRLLSYFIRTTTFFFPHVTEQNIQYI